MNNKNPLVSVILTSYNHAHYIGKTIESVLNQTFKDFELIILENVSTDNSAEIIRFYKDERIKFVINPQNIGMVLSVNKGIEIARGKYIAHVCADDIWHPTKLERQLEILEKDEKIATVFTRVAVINESGEFVDKKNSYQRTFDNVRNQNSHQWLLQLFNKGNCLCFPSAMTRRSHM